MDNLILKHFADIRIEDPFFDSLRESYDGFDEWFNRKAKSNEEALVYYNDYGSLTDFLYLKDETEALQLDDQVLPSKRRLKVGTFKIERRGTNRGERFMKRILDCAIQNNFQEVYVTLFDDTEELSHLRHFFEKYGFSEVGRKTNRQGRRECVLLRDLTTHTRDITYHYPFINKSIGNKYLLAIKPMYHTKLFPDSMLTTENYEILQDVSPTNSIYKIYICWMPETENLRHGDKVIIYRTSDGLGPAKYRSVTTSICTIEEIKTIQDFANIEEFVRYTNRYSIFKEQELRTWYQRRSHFIVLKMLYNMALTKKVIRKDIIEQAKISQSEYWGCIKLNDNQFETILNLGKADGRYFIN